MKRSEAAVLLAKIAAYDRRTVGDADIEAWAEALDDVPLPDALDAVRKHFQQSDGWLMPHGVITTVRAIRRDRMQRAGNPPMPGGLTWDQEKAWRVLWCASVKDGIPANDAAALASAAMNLPPEIEQAARPESMHEIAKAWAQRRRVTK